MAPPLPSRIHSTIRSHSRASWFLLATVVPFFLPFLILCMPILLLFLAPVSVFLFSFLLLYKVKQFLFPKIKGFHGRADKGVSHRTSRQIAAAKGLDIHQQASREEFKGFEGTNGKSAAREEVEGAEGPNLELHVHEKEDHEVDTCVLPSKVCEFEQEELGLPKEHIAVQDGRSEDELEERQLEQGPSVDEGGKTIRQEGSPEYEEPKVSYVQNVEVPDFLEAQGEEGLQRPEGEKDSTEGALEDREKELLQKERMQDDKHEEEEATQESIYLKDDQKQAERESDLTEGALEDLRMELSQKDRVPDDKQEEEEITRESIYLKDDQKQAERESDFTEGTLEDTGKESHQKDRMQDDKQEEEEATQESIDLKDQQKQSEKEGDKQEEEEATQESIHLKDPEKEPDRASTLAEGILQYTGEELPQKDRVEDGKQEEEEAFQESIYLKDEQKQPEREHDFAEGTLEHMGKELPYIDRMEVDKQEEEEATQESIDLREEKRQSEKESEFTEGTPGDVRKELAHIDRAEDDKQEEEETTQESIDLTNKQGLSETESEFKGETPEDVGKELPQKDRMEDSKQEEGEAIQELIDLRDKQEQPFLQQDATSSRSSEEFRPLTDEHRSFDKPYSGDHESSVPVDWHGPESTEDFGEKQESSHVYPFEESSGRLPSIEAKPAPFPEQTVESPCEEVSKQFAIDTPASVEHSREEPELSFTQAPHEHTREEPELSAKEDLSHRTLDSKGRLDKQEDIIFPAEPFERETVEEEPSHGLSESHGQLRRGPIAEETRDDEQPQAGKLAKDGDTSYEAEAASEREEGHPSEATSSAVPSPHDFHEGIENEDKIRREEQKIIADIDTIKKVVGYQGEPDTSILEQIRGLYVFLGMEPYDWAAEVDDLERAQAEIELLKVVVGIR